MKKIAIIGDYDPDFEPHRLTSDSFLHAIGGLSESFEPVWISTEEVNQSWLNSSMACGYWITPGSPYKSMAGALAAIRYAREHRIPALGNCGGFQHMVLEFARNVAGLKDVDHAENDPNASKLVISKLACSLTGKTFPVRIEEGSLAGAAYGRAEVRERYYCQFGINNEFLPDLIRAGLKATGIDDEGEVRIIELPKHPFFVGTLFVPQFHSKPGAPHPLIVSFLKAVSNH